MSTRIDEAAVRGFDLASRAAPFVALLLTAAYGTDAAVNHRWLGVAASGVVGLALLAMVWRTQREFRRGHLLGRVETYTALGEAATRDWTVEEWLWHEMVRHHADSVAWGFHRCRKSTPEATDCLGDVEHDGE